ncbi:MAG: hypothetical protein HZRFUVUK_000510 [Candidatus Fervidibacterota bacterium]|jgi:small basic protein
MVSLWIAVLALVIGILMGLYITMPITPFLLKFANYIGLAVLAGLDAIIGGARAGLQGNFDKGIFLSGFFVNMLMAVFLAYVGNRIIGVDLTLAIVVVFGLRIFNNLAVIRRIALDRFLQWYAQRRLASSKTSHSTAQQTQPSQTSDTAFSN